MEYTLNGYKILKSLRCPKQPLASHYSAREVMLYDEHTITLVAIVDYPLFD